MVMRLYYPSSSSSPSSSSASSLNMDRMSLNFIAPASTPSSSTNSTTPQQRGSPTVGNSHNSTWHTINDTYSTRPRGLDRCDSESSNDDIGRPDAQAAPKQKYTAEEEFVLMYLYIMLENSWKEAVKNFERWITWQHQGSTAPRSKRSEGGLQSAAYRLEDKWDMKKTRTDRDTGRRSKSNRDIYLDRIQGEGRYGLLEGLMTMFGAPGDVNIDRHGYRR